MLWQTPDPQRQRALEALNRRLAAVYRTEPKAVIFEFVSVIDQRVMLQDDGKIKVVREVLGDCAHSLGRIRLVIKPGWQNTAVHELVHLYNPGRREDWVKRATLDVIRLLKQGALWVENSGA